MFENIDLALPDPIFGLIEAFAKDENPEKDGWSEHAMDSVRYYWDTRMAYEQAPDIDVIRDIVTRGPLG